jgi:hypothetical protein
VAFPAVVTSTESATATASTSHTVNLPGSLVVGNLIIICCNKGTPAASAWVFNSVAGYSELVDEDVTNGITIWARQVDGTEGATVTMTSTQSIRSAETAYQISGADYLAIQPPQLSTVATGTSVNPNATTCTPTGGAKDYLWITMFGMAGEQADDDTLVTTAPTNYTGTELEKTCGVAGTNLGGMVASAHRTANAASEDVGSWTAIDNAAWRAYTIAVHPLPPRPGGPVTAIRVA